MRINAKDDYIKHKQDYYQLGRNQIDVNLKLILKIYKYKFQVLQQVGYIHYAFIVSIAEFSLTLTLEYIW